MIIIKLVLFIFLMPVGLLLFVCQNLYISHFLYRLSVGILTFIFSYLLGFIIGSKFIALTAFFLLLMRLFYRIENIKSKTPKKLSFVLKGRFQKVQCIFILPLSFVNLIKKLPFIKNKPASKNSRSKITISELIDLILHYRKDLHVNIQTSEIDISLAIH